MHNAWESNVSKMHAIANASDSSMYISVNLLAYFFPLARPRKKKRKRETRMRKEAEGGVGAAGKGRRGE